MGHGLAVHTETPRAVSCGGNENHLGFSASTVRQAGKILFTHTHLTEEETDPERGRDSSEVTQQKILEPS